MNEEKLLAVGALTEVESGDITQKNIRKNLTLSYYYLIQFALFIFSSLVGLVFGLIGNSLSYYPYSAFPQRYTYGSLVLLITHGSNFGFFYQLSRQKRLMFSKSEPKLLSHLYIYPAIVLNILLSTISLFSIHNLVTNGSPLTINTLYGVYSKGKSNKIRKII
ncbi:MAG: hypothetical protein ACTSVO_02830 [Candidatus Heimdallarchaeaceae archaeon]